MKDAQSWRSDAFGLLKLIREEADELDPSGRTRFFALLKVLVEAEYMAEESYMLGPEEPEESSS